MIFILIVSLIPIMVTLKDIPGKFYPLIIFLVSLALLYHVTLFSNFLVGSDIFSEFGFYKPNLESYSKSSAEFNFKHSFNPPDL